MAVLPTIPPQTTTTPDPSDLTTKAVDRLKETMKELFGVQFSEFNLRLDRIQLQMDARPATIVSEISHLRQLVDEKFKGVADNFAGRDTALAAALLAQKTSVEEQNKSNATSANKSEATFTKQIEGITALITTQTKASDEKVDAVRDLIGAQTKASDEKFNDLRDRLTTSEGKASVADPATVSAIAQLSAVVSNLSTNGNMSKGHAEGADHTWGLVISIGGLIAAVLVVIVMFIALREPSTPQIVQVPVASVPVVH